jgi:hypothetical protein
VHNGKLLLCLRLCGAQSHQLLLLLLHRAREAVKGCHKRVGQHLRGGDSAGWIEAQEAGYQVGQVPVHPVEMLHQRALRDGAVARR